MITEVELVDFLSHRDTSVAFGPGMNVIVGPNGAGKSSIVDAITFALFGRHTRRVNRSIVRHGAPSGLARVTFESSGRTLRATRKIKGGVATPILEEASGEAWENIAAGERRQMGESTTREIESAVGMNFERMQIASIISAPRRPRGRAPTWRRAGASSQGTRAKREPRRQPRPRGQRWRPASAERASQISRPPPSLRRASRAGLPSSRPRL